jgi:1-acyl-sn-glycerol-3-phosphate acyltransferase
MGRRHHRIDRPRVLAGTGNMPAMPDDAHQPTIPPASQRPAPLWRNVSFTLMWTSTAASGFGDRMMMLAALALLGGTGQNADSTAINAATQFWFFLPYILFSIPAGWLADRMPRKWLMLICDEARGVTLLASFTMLGAAAGLAVLPVDQQWKVALALLVVGLFASIFNPTRNAIVPQIIPRPQLSAANAIILGINVVASLIGIYVGGKIIDPTDASTVRLGLLVGALLYLISGTFFAFLKPVDGVALPGIAVPSRSLLQGLIYLSRHRRHIVLVVLGILVWSSAAAVTSAVLGLLKGHFNLADAALFQHYTGITAMIGAGMLVGAIVISLLRVRRESTTIIMAALIGAGLAIVTMTAVPWMPLTYAAAFGLGFTGNIVIVLTMTLLQSMTPNYMRGRIMGINSMVNTMFSVATYFAIWRMPHADTGIIVVLWMLGPALMVLGGFGLIRYLRSGPLKHEHALNFFWRLARVYTLVWHRVQWVGKHHVPHTGPVILAANHTTGLDPFVIQSAVPRLVRWVMLTSYQYRVLNFFWKRVKPVALDLDNADFKKLREIITITREGNLLGIFPEGELQRSHRNLAPFKPGIGLIAHKAKATIVPVWIEGTPLVHNMWLHFLVPSRTAVVFGEPWTPDAKLTHEQLVEQLRERMLALKPLAERARSGK